MYQDIPDVGLQVSVLMLIIIMCPAGTLRPDLIESASALASTNAQVIKTHHNDTELVRELRNLVRGTWWQGHGSHDLPIHVT